jgi:hypothetical protein
MSNGAIFDPDDRSLIISAKVGDVNVFPEAGGRITIAVSALEDGIEIINSKRELWWPV